MLNSLRNHWPEYLMEAAGLGIFMVSACLFTILLYHPASPVMMSLPNEFHRRVLVGMAMGLTAICIIYSPWGKQSGAHLNPAVTLTFFRLGKIAPWDAVFYVTAQFLGGIAGVALVATFLGRFLADPTVNFVTTTPGHSGLLKAFLGEAVISFILIMVVLLVSNTARLARFTGIFAGLCVATFITFESPFSGMSMNPARTLGSAIISHRWDNIWIYFVAPQFGMLLAATLYSRLKNCGACAKLHHHNSKRCIFCKFQNQKAVEN